MILAQLAFIQIAVVGGSISPDSSNCGNLMSSAQLKGLKKTLSSKSRGYLEVDRASLVTELLEVAVLHQSAADVTFMKDYVAYEQAVASFALESNSKTVTKPKCISVLRNKLITYILKNKPEPGSLSADTREAFAMLEKGFAALNSVAFLQSKMLPNALTQIEKLSFPWIGYYAWDPMRKYLGYRTGLFSSRHEAYKNTTGRLDLDREVMRYRLQAVLATVDDEDGSLGLITSFIASHYGFVFLTGEFFRESITSWPGEAGRKAEIFALTNMSAEISWLTLSRKIMTNCFDSPVSEPNSLYLAEMIHKQETVASESRLWPTIHFALSLALLVASISLMANGGIHGGFDNYPHAGGTEAAGTDTTGDATGTETAAPATDDAAAAATDDAATDDAATDDAATDDAATDDAATDDTAGADTDKGSKAAKAAKDAWIFKDLLVERSSANIQGKVGIAAAVASTLAFARSAFLYDRAESKKVAALKPLKTSGLTCKSVMTAQTGDLSQLLKEADEQDTKDSKDDGDSSLIYIVLIVLAIAAFAYYRK